MPPDVEPVRCRCGETLLDGMDESHVVVGDDEFRFRRTTDFVACTSCGTMYQIGDLQPGINEDPAAEPAELIDDPLEELRKLSQQFELEAEASTSSPEDTDDFDYA